MKVIRQHIKDFEKNKDGSYKYYYEYDLYEFIDGDLVYLARGYRDTFEEISFLRRIFKKEKAFIEKANLGEELLLEAVDYLKNEGKKVFCYFDLKEGYVKFTT